MGAAGIGTLQGLIASQWRRIRFYYYDRPHQPLGYQTPAAVWAAGVSPVTMGHKRDEARGRRAESERAYRASFRPHL
jgi:hypothetical protein